MQWNLYAWELVKTHFNLARLLLVAPFCSKKSKPAAPESLQFIAGSISVYSLFLTAIPHPVQHTWVGRECRVEFLKHRSVPLELERFLRAQSLEGINAVRVLPVTHTTSMRTTGTIAVYSRREPPLWRVICRTDVHSYRGLTGFFSRAQSGFIQLKFYRIVSKFYFRTLASKWQVDFAS